MLARTSIVALVACLCLTAPWSRPLGGQEVSHLNFVARLSGYYDVAYVDQPVAPARHVFFTSEAIEVALDIGNESDDTQSLGSGLPIARALRVETRLAPAGVTSVELQVDPAGELSVVGTPTRVVWGQPIEFGPRATATWQGRIVGAKVPGTYELRVTPTFGRSPEPVAPLGTVVMFELRAARTLADRAELARRKAMREYAYGDETTVEAAVKDLLAVYPQSALAYQIRGRAAAEANRNDVAQASFDRALQLITSGADKLLLQHLSKRDVDAMATELRQGVRSR